MPTNGPGGGPSSSPNDPVPPGGQPERPGPPDGHGSPDPERPAPPYEPPRARRADPYGPPDPASPGPPDTSLPPPYQPGGSPVPPPASPYGRSAYGPAAPYDVQPGAVQPYPHVNPFPKNNLGVWALVLGILAAASLPTCCGLGGFIGIPAVVLGMKARRAQEEGQADNAGMGTAGVVTGWIGVASFVLVVLLIVVMAATGELD